MRGYRTYKTFGRIHQVAYPAVLALLILAAGCVREFVPPVAQSPQFLVVEGLITDRNEADTIKLSLSTAMGKKTEATPLSGCIVTVSDDLGQIFSLYEAKAGAYVTDPATFTGAVGRSYTLHISRPFGMTVRNYESLPSEMMPVPPIDSLYYQKTLIQEETKNDPRIEGCMIYVDTKDPENKCRFYRWDFTETWLHRILWPVDNSICWITNVSNRINIKTTDAIYESSISKHEVTYITNETDRLQWRYSILVNQYSINQDEFNFWEKMKKLTEQNGGLYDIIPSSVESNIQCISYPEERVLGYFCVSAKATRRIYIKDSFAGIIDRYKNCADSTAHTDDISSIPFYGIKYWALLIHHGSFADPPWMILTRTRGCADCTVRGSNIKPDFWIYDESY